MAMIEQVQAVIDAAVASGYTTGITALVGNGDVAQVVTAGGTTRETIFRISSDTKPITAVATLLLVQDGVFGLGDAIERWLPELTHRRVLRHVGAELDDTVPANRPLTIEDLLTFRCGIGFYFPPAGAPPPIVQKLAELRVAGAPDPTLPFDFDGYMKRVATLPLAAQPGEDWFYTTGSNLLGVLIERASGKPLEAFLRERIFTPLAMNDTGFCVPPKKTERLSKLHHRDNGQLILDDDPADSAWAKPPKFHAADAGLISTVDDMFALARMIMNDGRPLLPPSAIKDITSNHLTQAQRDFGIVILGAGNGWGYGGSVALTTTAYGCPAGTYGWGGGMGTSWYLHAPSRKTAIVFTETKWDTPRLPQVHQDVLRAVFA